MINRFLSHTTRRDLILILLFSLLIQTFWAIRLEHPTYFDAYYYTTNGQRIAEGHWTEWIIWQYLDSPEQLPTPSHTYWMPLPSILAAAGYIVSDSFRAAQTPFWLLVTFLPLLAYAISRFLRPDERWQARVAALFTAAGGYYAAYWAQPSTFGLFAFMGGACLLALGRAAQKQKGATWFLAGLLAGLCHLTRADGVLLVGVGGLVWLGGLWDWRQAHGSWRALLRRDLNLPTGNIIVFVIGYLLIMTPWFIHMQIVTGQPLSTIGTQTLFLTEYNDTFAYNRQFTLESYLDWGWGNILKSKLKATSLAAQTFIGVTGLTFLSLFLLWGWLKLGRKGRIRPFLRPFTLYTLVLYISMPLLFTFPGQRGSLLHSSSALWPWSMALSAAGISYAVDWVASRLRHWRPEKSKPLFASMFVMVVFIISFIVSGSQPRRRDEARAYHDISTNLLPHTQIMTGDPPAFYYHTGYPAVVVPAEPIAIVLEAMDHYDIDYLLLDPDHPPELADFYAGHEDKAELELLATFEFITFANEPGIMKLYWRHDSQQAEKPGE